MEASNYALLLRETYNEHRNSNRKRDDCTEFHYALDELKRLYDLSDRDAADFIYSTTTVIHRSVTVRESTWFGEMMKRPCLFKILNENDFYDYYLYKRFRDKVQCNSIDITIIRTLFSYIYCIRPPKRIQYVYEVIKWLTESDEGDVLFLRLNPLFRKMALHKKNEFKKVGMSKYNKRSIASMLKKFITKCDNCKINYILILNELGGMNIGSYIFSFLF